MSLINYLGAGRLRKQVHPEFSQAAPAPPDVHFLTLLRTIDMKHPDKLEFDNRYF